MFAALLAFLGINISTPTNKPLNGWISVKDKKPLPDELVLVFFTRDKAIFVARGNNSGRACLPDYWQPLPPAPNEKVVDASPRIPHPATPVPTPGLFVTLFAVLVAGGVCGVLIGSGIGHNKGMSDKVGQTQAQQEQTNGKDERMTIISFHTSAVKDYETAKGKLAKARQEGRPFYYYIEDVQLAGVRLIAAKERLAKVSQNDEAKRIEKDIEAIYVELASMK